MDRELRPRRPAARRPRARRDAARAARRPASGSTPAARRGSRPARRAWAPAAGWSWSSSWSREPRCRAWSWTGRSLSAWAVVEVAGRPWSSWSGSWPDGGGRRRRGRRVRGARDRSWRSPVAAGAARRPSDDRGDRAAATHGGAPRRVAARGVTGSARARTARPAVAGSRPARRAGARASLSACVLTKALRAPRVRIQRSPSVSSARPRPVALRAGMNGESLHVPGPVGPAEQAVAGDRLAAGDPQVRAGRRARGLIEPEVVESPELVERRRVDVEHGRAVGRGRSAGSGASARPAGRRAT